METKNPIDIGTCKLNNEAQLIEDVGVREKVEYLIDESPAYFLLIPASSSGKYHPSYALGEGGLVRHTVAAVRIANELLKLEQHGHLIGVRDEIIGALLLHDCLKSGISDTGITDTNHPNYAADYVLKCFPTDVHMIRIAEYIRSHMGQWNMDYKSNNEIMPKPISDAAKFVHLCDYLASRKFLEFNFDA